MLVDICLCGLSSGEQLRAGLGQLHERAALVQLELSAAGSSWSSRRRVQVGHVISALTMAHANDGCGFLACGRVGVGAGFCVWATLADCRGRGSGISGITFGSSGLTFGSSGITFGSGLAMGRAPESGRLLVPLELSLSPMGIFRLDCDLPVGRPASFFGKPVM
jgi:hypothetical protein